MARQAGAKPSAGAATAAPDGKAQAGKPAPQRLTLTRAAGLSTDVRTLAVNLTILAVIIRVVPVIASQFLREQVLIEPIAVPEALLATGLTPEVAANRLWDGLKEVKEAAGSSKGSVTAIPDSKQVDFSIPDSGLSIDSLIYYVRQFFNAYETRIGGEFRCADPACSPAGITLRLRVVRDDMELLQLPPMGPRAEAEYFRDAAGEVMAVLDPFTAIAADAAAEPKRAQVLARRLIRSGHKDAKWAHNLIGNMLLDDNDIAGAETAYRAALALDPDFPTARTNLGNALRIKWDVAGAPPNLRCRRSATAR